MRDVPAPDPTTSTTLCGSSPAFMASTSASAAATLWMATRWLATNFILLPLPIGPEVPHLAREAGERRRDPGDGGRIAAGEHHEVLDRGLRARARHRAIERGVAGLREDALEGQLVLERERAGLGDDAALGLGPGDARATSSTAAGVGRLVTISLAASATAAALSAISTPAARASPARAASTSNPTTFQPPAARWRANAPPMMPSPMMPMVLSMAVSVPVGRNSEAYCAIFTARSAQYG